MTEHRFGSFRFRDVNEDEVLCVICDKVFKRKTMKKHVDVHDRREQKRLETAAIREIGLTRKKPLPGQLGLGGLADEVIAKPKKAKAS